MVIMIQVTNLSKSFGDIKAVDGLSFEIKEGEIVGLLGPNGAGKTTTMRLLTGFLSPDRGKISIEGISVEENPTAAQAQIGYLPENNPLYKEMLVSEFLELSAELKNISKEERKSAYDFTVSATGTGEVFYRPIGELSKGYKQRVGLAAALLHKPKILIMDEPTEGLDPNQRTEIRALIKKLAKDRTIIMSTHVMQEASAVCNRMLIINKGKLVADGTPQQLSRAAKKERSLLLEIEGSDIESALKALPGLESSKIEKISRGRYKAELIAQKDTELQPEISNLAHKHKWVIWELVEEEQGLEEVFRKLTA